jgi:hypothetical protein
MALKRFRGPSDPPRGERDHSPWFNVHVAEQDDVPLARGVEIWATMHCAEDDQREAPISKVLFAVTAFGVIILHDPQK